MRVSRSIRKPEFLVSAATVETIENKLVPGSTRPPTGYRQRAQYDPRDLKYDAPPAPALFALPAAGMREVKGLSEWDAAKVRKELVGKPAPDLAVTDLQGNQLALASFQGRTVLLDFWTTWCPPCRADASALDNLYKKYGERGLMIIGLSVGEDRETVEQFLKGNHHRFPIALTIENEMPRAYKVSAVPTYIMIDRDGKVAWATDGDQGIAQLYRLLKKAGLELD